MASKATPGKQIRLDGKNANVVLSLRPRQQGALAHCLVAVPGVYLPAASMVVPCGFAYPPPMAQKIATRSRDAPDTAVEQLVQRAISRGVDLEHESMTRVRHLSRRAWESAWWVGVKYKQKIVA